MNSKSKGARGELEFAAALCAAGVTARRGRQYHGDPSAPDVIAELPGVHWEIKRCERIDLYPWFRQAVLDAGTRTPVVALRKNREDWLVVLRLEDLLPLLSKCVPADTSEAA